MPSQECWVPSWLTDPDARVEHAAGSEGLGSSGRQSDRAPVQWSSLAKSSECRVVASAARRKTETNILATIGQIMKKLFLAFVGILLMTGCVYRNYSLVVYNGTADQIDGTAVLLQDGRIFRFGVMNPKVCAGMESVKGPVGDVATVKWIDLQGSENDAEAPIACRLMDDSIIFLIHSNDTVTVQTGRDLYGPRLPRDSE
jgi:hypothetical protein